MDVFFLLGEITSAHYCSQMGQDVTINLPAEYPFMTIDGTEFIFIE